MEHERGKICSFFGEEEKCIQSFGEAVGRNVHLGRQRQTKMGE